MTSDDYLRSNRLQKAISQDDDLWTIYFEQEKAAALVYINERTQSGSMPLAVLSGVVGAAAQLTGMGSHDGNETYLITDLHGILENSCEGGCNLGENPGNQYDQWGAEIMPEFMLTMKYYELRIKERSASYAILCGMVAAAGSQASNVIQAGVSYDMRPHLHSTIQSLFDGGCEMKFQMREPPIQ